MEGENLTPFPAILLTTCIDDTHMYASMITRVTYDVRDDGAVVPCKEQPWGVSLDPWESPVGVFDADQPYRKGGVDVFVAGDAVTPEGAPQKELTVGVEIGEAFKAQVIVVGERHWRRSPGIKGLVPSDPVPFTTAPLGLAGAFGGAVEVDGLAVGFPLNDKGTGFYLTEDAALGKPLPRLEDPEQRIKTWEDRPDPVGFGALESGAGLRLRRAVTIENDRIQHVSSLMFNQAFPRMVAPKVSPGDRVVATGFLPEGPLTFTIPPHHLAVHLFLGLKHVERHPVIEEVGIEPAKRRVYLGYRYPFRYEVVAHERRRCRLTPT